MVQESPLVIYEAPDGTIAIDVRLEGESVRLTEAQIAVLFQTDPSVVVKHISNIYRSGELDEEGTCEKKMHMFKKKVIARLPEIYATTI